MREERTNGHNLRGGRALWVFLPLVLLGACYCYLASRIGTSLVDGGPDESARMLVSRAILHGNLLPSGYDPETIELWGNYSYAFYPQVLCAYVTALFELVPCLVGAPGIVQLYFARLSSVAWGLLGAWFLGKAVETLLAKEQNAHVYRAFSMMLMGFWPQYVFLSSYVNNDIAAVASTAMLMYALVRGIARGWDVSTCAVLCAAIVVAALTYLDVYGFIAAAIVVFICSCLRQNRGQRQRALRLILGSALACAVFTFPFFIVNVVRYGDVTGARAFEASYEEWVAATGTELMHPYDGGAVAMLFDSSFAKDTAMSFVGVFGYMKSPIPAVGMAFFAALALVFGVAALLSKTLRSACLGPKWRVFVAATAAAVLITIFMHVWRSATVDYQPQGRYVIPNLAPLCLMVTLGVWSMLGGRERLVVALAVVIALVSVCSMVQVTRQDGWKGMCPGTEEFVERVTPGHLGPA